MAYTHIPRPIRATVLAHARGMRNMKGDQGPDQWLDAQYRAAAALAQDLRLLHGIHAPQWAHALIWRVAT